LLDSSQSIASGMRCTSAYGFAANSVVASCPELVSIPETIMRWLHHTQGGHAESVSHLQAILNALMPELLKDEARKGAHVCLVCIQ
jgi:hypothetical protein